MMFRVTLSAVILGVFLYGCSSVDETLPHVTPVYPTHGTTIMEDDPRLEWSQPEQAVRYHIQLGGTADFSGKHIIDINNTIRNETPLSSYRYGETYYWRVRYQTADKTWSSWSDPWKFATYIGAPAPKSPTANDYLHDTRPRFAWSVIREASSYDFELYAEGEVNNPRRTIEKIESAFFFFTEDLNRSTSYLWRVRARYPDEITGTWSDFSSFTIVTAWKRSYGLYSESLDFRVSSVAPIGNRIVLGGNIRIWNGTDAAIVITDKNGAVEQSIALGLRPRDDIVSVATAADTLIAVMTTSTVERDDRNPWIVKFTDDGEAVWQTFLRSIGEQTASDVAMRAAGDAIIAGSTIQPSESDTDDADNEDGMLISIDDSGNTVWMKRYDGSGTDSFASVVVDSDFYYVSGTTDSFEGTGKSIVVAKIDLDGLVIWSNIYDGSIDESCGGPDSIYIGKDSSIRIAGSASRSGRVGGSMLNLNIDADGALVSAFTMGGENRSFATSVAETDDGDLILGGNVMADSPIAGGLIRTPKVIRLSAEGEIVWQRGTWGAYPQTVESILVQPEGSVIAAGWWYEFNLDSSWMMNVDTAGQYPPDPASIELTSEAAALEVREISFSVTNIDYTPWKATGTIGKSSVDSRLMWP